VAEHESFELLARLGACIDRIFTRPRQIRDRLIGGLGDPDPPQFPGSRELGQPNAAAPIRLDPITPPLGNQRRGNHLADKNPAASARPASRSLTAIVSLELGAAFRAAYVAGDRPPYPEEAAI